MSITGRIVTHNYILDRSITFTEHISFVHTHAHVIRWASSCTCHCIMHINNFQKWIYYTSKSPKQVNSFIWYSCTEVYVLHWSMSYTGKCISEVNILRRSMSYAGQCPMQVNETTECKRIKIYSLRRGLPLGSLLNYSCILRSLLVC